MWTLESRSFRVGSQRPTKQIGSLMWNVSSLYYSFHVRKMGKITLLPHRVTVRVRLGNSCKSHRTAFPLKAYMGRWEMLEEDKNEQTASVSKIKLWLRCRMLSTQSYKACDGRKVTFWKWKNCPVVKKEATWDTSCAN